MNAKEVATLLGLHPNTIYSMIREGNIQAEKKGRSFDIPDWQVEELKDWQDISSSSEERKREHLNVAIGYEQDITIQLWNLTETTKAFQEFLNKSEFNSFSQSEMNDFLKEQYQDKESLLNRFLLISERIKELQLVVNYLRSKTAQFEEESRPVKDMKWDFSDIELNEIPVEIEVKKK